MIKKLFFILIICMVVSPVWATTSTVGPSKDYATIQLCVNARTTAGDICDVYSGTYAEAVASKGNGSEGSPITIQCHTGETCIVNRFSISHNYNVVDGFRIIGSGMGDGSTAGTYVSGNYNTIQNNTVVGSSLYSTAGNYGAKIAGAYNTITGNTFDGGTNYVGTHTGANNSADLTDSTKTWSVNELQGMYVMNWGQTGTLKKVYNLSITSNTSDTVVATLSGSENWDTGDIYMVGQGLYTVILTTGANNTISNNTIKNLADTEKVFSFTAGCDDTTISGNEAYTLVWSQTEQVHPDIFQRVDPGAGTCANGIVEKNYFHDMDTQIGILESSEAAEIAGWIFRNNVFANITQRMMLGRDGVSEPVAEYYNNTFFQVNTATGGIIDVYANQILRNNVLIGSNTGSTRNLLGGTPADATHSYNYYSLPMDSSYTARDAATLAAQGGTNNINGGDPLFVAAYNDCVNNACDFKLQALSPLRNAGTDLSGVWGSATDKDGVARPQGVAWDVGAYEYNSEVADETAPAEVVLTIPETGSSLTHTISTFTCTDAVGVTGYCVNESAVAPTAGSCSGSGWSGSAQSSYTFGTAGAKTLYGWCKDAAGNISTSANDTTTITLPSASTSGCTISVGGTGSATKGSGTGRMIYQQ